MNPGQKALAYALAHPKQPGVRGKGKGPDVRNIFNKNTMAQAYALIEAGNKLTRLAS